MALFLWKPVQVLKRVPGSLARQLLQAALMDGARHGFIEAYGADGAQLLTQSEKIHWRRTASGLAQPSQSFRAAIGRDELIQLPALDQREVQT